MGKKQFITRVACFIGYLLFASFSAYFTATSLSLNLLAGTNVWIVFVLVLIISILAGWCLTNAIKEFNKRINASKGKFVINILGFLIFWAFSFTTNVHFFFVEKHGYNILVKELASAKNYIIDNTSRSNRAIDEQNERAQKLIEAQVLTNEQTFTREINNSMEGHIGFGENCINILNSTEAILNADSKTIGDYNKYVIFDETRDSGDKGVTQRSMFPGLLTKYLARMEQSLNTKKTAIDRFYSSKKNQDEELTQLLPIIDNLEKKHLPEVLKDGSVNAFFIYSDQQNGKVISKMPDKYNQKCVTKNKKGDIIKYNVYPSQRMFDTMSVWSDILSSRLVGLTMVQWIIISIILDIVAFILFALARKEN